MNLKNKETLSYDNKKIYFGRKTLRANRYLNIAWGWTFALSDTGDIGGLLLL